MVDKFWRNLLDCEESLKGNKDEEEEQNKAKVGNHECYENSSAYFLSACKIHKCFKFF